MPDIRPFHGVRYDMAQVGALVGRRRAPLRRDRPGAPGQALRRQPLQHHPARAEPGGAGRRRRGEPLHPRGAVLERLAHATACSARTPPRRSTSTTRASRSWGPPTPARASWRGSGSSRSAQGKIYPHEQTLAGPKADRLALYQATRYNLSPIFGLYADPEAAVLRAVEAGLRDRTPLEATDHLGVKNRLWPIDDPKTHTAGAGPDGAAADLHRRRPPPLRDRPEVPRRAWPRPAPSPAPTTRPTSA